ncbi:MAG: SGNH/GDSL hydrolase family protein [Anaerolineae bacterium]|nr:SGNH/GDSL hydrolase family protein [Anaerolineae bacterium]
MALRLIDPPFYSSSLKAYHPDLGWTSRPNTVLHRSINQSYLVRYETNSLGFRDVEHSYEQLRNVPNQEPIKIRRIVIIGDSFSEAAQVDLQQTYWFKLKEILNQQSRDYWEFHNFGLGDYGTVQELITLQQFGIPYHPDLIILQVFPFNDILNNSLTGANTASNQDAYRPYLDPENNFQTITYVNPVTNRLRKQSVLLRFSFLMVNQYIGTWGNEHYFLTIDDRMAFIKQQVPTDELTTGYDKFYFYYYLFNTFTPPEHQLDIVKEGWQATEQAISQIIKTAQDNRSKTLILVVPHTQQLSPFISQWKQDLPYPIDPKYAEDRIQAYVQPYDVPVIRLIDSFEGNHNVVQPYLEGHFNIETHTLVAKMLASTIVQRFPESFSQSAYIK